MNKGETRVSRRLREVWEWKEANYREVAHLPIPQALDEILRKAREAGARHNLPRATPGKSSQRSQ